MRRGILALGVAGFLAAPLALAETTYSPEELERESFQSLQQGDPVRALAFAEALLARDNTDVTPHLLRARALRDMGRDDEAQDAARSAWKLSKTGEEKFSSSLIMAQTLSSAGKRTRAQLWLRRAVEHAPAPQLAARARRDFKYVQQQNPWQTNLSFTLAPNSNINNGSIRDTMGALFYDGNTQTIVDPELLGGALALSGFEYGASVQTRYRFSQTERTAHDIFMNASYRTYILSGSARDILRDELLNDLDPFNDADPIATGADFAYGTASLGYRFSKFNFDGHGEMSASAVLGKSWYGGNPYATTLRGSVQQSYRQAPDRKLTFGVDATLQDGQATSDSENIEMFASLNKQLQSGDGLYLSFSVAAQQSPNPTHEYVGIEARSGYSLGKPVMGAALQLGVGASYRDYDVSNLSSTGRQDLTVSADITAVFREIDYYGFNPSVTLSASSTASNLNLYDSNRVGLSIGIRSAF